MNKKIKSILDPIKVNKIQEENILNNILNKKKTRKSSINYVGVLSGFLLILSLYFLKDPIKNLFPTSNETPIGLPKISFELTSEGMGYSGIMLYSRDELANNNPWNEAMKLETLPVFENEFPFDYKDLKKFIPREEKDNLAESIGKSFGIDDLKYDNFTERYFSSDFYINVFLDLSSVISWENSIPLPNIDEKDDYSRQVKYAEYYYDLYKSAFNLTEVEFELTCSYSFHGEKSYDHGFYEASGSDLEKILNYNFNKISLGIHEDIESENGLSAIGLPSVYKHKKIGDYPIISKDEAIENILKGNYLTTVPYDEDIQLEDIAKIELTYYVHSSSKYFQPVYKAYIELENDRQENGLITYGIYYTPAISEEYVDILIDDVFFN